MCDSASLRNGLRVLVVDSNPDSCELLAILLAQYGAETIAATCVSEAIEKLQQFQPDLLISEIALPDEDGYSLIQQVKALETAYSIRIPAIALTVCAGDHERDQAIAAGFCSHLPKPINIDKFIATVASLTQPTQVLSANYLSIEDSELLG